MKTLKFALIAAIVACTMVSLAKADGFKEKPTFKKVKNITLVQAMKVPGLPQAMYQQLDVEDFLDNPQAVFTAEVTLNGNIYRITGSRDEWVKFFKLEVIHSVKAKHNIKNLN